MNDELPIPTSLMSGSISCKNLSYTRQNDGIKISEDSLDNSLVKQVSTTFELRKQIDIFADTLKEKFGETITSWAFPILDRNEALEEKITESAFITLQKMVWTNAELASDPKFDSPSLHRESPITIDQITPPSNDPILPNVRLGGLTNGRNDCFINSSLQLLKALSLKISDTIATSLPSLLKFLTGGLRTDSDCRCLRSEINTAILSGHQEFCDSDLNDIVVNGTAQTQQDAAAFLELLLERLDAPTIHYEETLTNTGTREVKESTGISHASSTILPLTLPPLDSSGSHTMQEIIDTNFAPEKIEGFNWIEGDPTSSTAVTKKKTLTDPTPESLVLFAGRFDSDLFTRPDGGITSTPFKKKDSIQGILAPITLPLKNQKTRSYEPTAIICHVGTSISAGHYVCYRKEEGQWLLFNDDAEVAKRIDQHDHDFIKKNCYLISYSQAEIPDSSATWRNIDSDNEE